MSRLPALWSRAATTVRQPRFLGFAVVVVVLLALYAYFMRPTAQPFARLPIDPLRPWLVPGRSYVEEALPNLGQYLSLPVLWMAVGAWLATSVTAVLRRTLRPLPVLVVIGGFSALYFWNQAITPDHFWAIRRFVPIILPAAVVFAGVAGAFALSFLPVRWRPLLFGLAVLALALQTWRAGWPMFFVAERAGTYEALQRFATELPSGVTFMGPLDRIGMHRSGTALFMSFDTDVLPIAFDGETGREEIISRLRRASIERPIAIISSPDDPALDGEPMARIHHEFTLMAQTLRPVPQAVIDGELNLVARWVAGASTLDLEVGSRSHWLVQERGFFSPDTVRDHQARWTNGDAELTIPIFDGAEPERLVVELDWTGPKGALLNVTFGGIQLALVDLPDGDWTATFDLPRDAVDDREEVIVGLRSSTFVPANALEGSQDTRHLGVMVRSIRLLGPDS